MITISIDRCLSNLGCSDNGTTEYSLLMSHLLEMSTVCNKALFVPPCKMKDRLAFINKSVYFASIELRIKNDYIDSNGMSVVYKPTAASEMIANYIYSGLSGKYKFESEPAVAYYHGKKENGLDFLVEHSDNSTVIMYLGYIKESSEILSRCKELSLDLATILNELF